MFEVVKHEQRVLAAEHALERSRLVVPGVQTNRPGNRRGHERRVPERRQIDEKDPVLEMRSQRVDGSECEPRFPDAAWAGEREQAQIAT